MSSPSITSSDESGDASDQEESTSEHNAQYESVSDDEGDASETTGAEADTASTGSSADARSGSDGGPSQAASSISKRKRRLLKDRKRMQWMHYTKQERDIGDQVERLQARDLTYHLLSIHGFYARKRARQRAEITALDHVTTQGNASKSLDDWTPRIVWTAWPLHPSTVPRPQPRVWYSSITKAEPYSSKTELKEQLSAYVLRTAHARWTARTSSNTTMASQHFLSQKPLVSDEPNASSKTQIGVQHTLLPRATFSADDERSQRIIAPTVNSTISAFDDTLLAIHRSRVNVLPGRFTTTDTLNRLSFTRLVDWRELLGIAALAGLPAAAISRATARCAAAFGEPMGFTLLREEDVKTAIPPAQMYEPGDIRSSAEIGPLLHDPPDAQTTDWDVLSGCAYRECEMFAREPVLPGQLNSLIVHMRQVHKWQSGVPSAAAAIASSGNRAADVPDWKDETTALITPIDLEDAASGIVGGVHVDGFMQPLTRRIRTRTKRRKLDAVNYSDADTADVKAEEGEALEADA